MTLFMIMGVKYCQRNKLHQMKTAKINPAIVQTFLPPLVKHDLDLPTRSEKKIEPSLISVNIFIHSLLVYSRKQF